MLFRTLPRFLSQRTLLCTENALLLSKVKVVTLSNRRIPASHVLHLSQTCLCRRALSTPAPHINNSELPMDRYHVLADATMSSLLERLEDLLDEIANDGFEVDYHSGVLTLNLGANGTYVINKQPPNKQIWLSSPISGPKRYDYMPSTDDWRYSRNGERMDKLLEQELSRAFEREVKVGLERVSDVVEQGNSDVKV